jgi:hypothetical protein
MSLQATVEQLAQSSQIPVSNALVHEVVVNVANAVPWFCQVLKLDKKGCLSSDEDQLGIDESTMGHRRKENVSKTGKDVEGLLIFAKKDGKLIGLEDVLREFRDKRAEWEMLK